MLAAVTGAMLRHSTAKVFAFSDVVLRVRAAKAVEVDRHIVFYLIKLRKLEYTCSLTFSDLCCRAIRPLNKPKVYYDGANASGVPSYKMAR